MKIKMTLITIDDIDDADPHRRAPQYPKEDPIICSHTGKPLPIAGTGHVEGPYNIEEVDPLWAGSGWKNPTIKPVPEMTSEERLEDRISRLKRHIKHTEEKPHPAFRDGKLLLSMQKTLELYESGELIWDGKDTLVTAEEGIVFWGMPEECHARFVQLRHVEGKKGIYMELVRKDSSRENALEVGERCNRE